MALVGLTRDRYHRYQWNGGDILPSVTSVLKVQDALGGTDGLMTWAVNLAVNHLLDNPNGDPEALRRGAHEATKRPKSLGTAVHEQVRRVIAGEPLELTAETAPFIGHFAAFLAKERPEFLASEEMIANLSLGYAGQFDFIAKLRGKTACVDVKTGKPKPTHRLQLAGYQMAEFIGRPGDPEQHPVPRTNAGFVLALRQDGYDLLPMTPGAADRKHFELLCRTYHTIAAWQPQEGEA